MIITLEESLNEIGEEAEFESLKKFNDKENMVKVSKYNNLRAKTLWLIELLNEYFEVEKEGDNHILKLKKLHE